MAKQLFSILKFNYLWAILVLFIHPQFTVLLITLHNLCCLNAKYHQNIYNFTMYVDIIIKLKVLCTNMIT